MARTDFNEALHACGLAERDLHLHDLHDLRGTAATKFYKAGFKEREIAVILAWSERNVSRIITKYINKEAILKEQIARMDAASTKLRA